MLQNVRNVAGETQFLRQTAQHLGGLLVVGEGRIGLRGHLVEGRAHLKELFPQLEAVAVDVLLHVGDQIRAGVAEGGSQAAVALIIQEVEQQRLHIGLLLVGVVQLPQIEGQDAPLDLTGPIAEIPAIVQHRGVIGRIVFIHQLLVISFVANPPHFVEIRALIVGEFRRAEDDVILFLLVILINGAGSGRGGHPRKAHGEDPRQHRDAQDQTDQFFHIHDLLSPDPGFPGTKISYKIPS